MIYYFILSSHIKQWESEFKNDIIWMKIDHFKKNVLCSDNVTTDVDYLHVKRIHLVGFSYIVIEDKTH
jgi:hypothetical protein